MIKSRFLKVGPTELGVHGSNYKVYQYWVKPIKVMGDSALLSVVFATPDLPDKNML